MSTLYTRKFEQDGFTVIIQHVFDDSMRMESPDVLQANYEGCPPEEKATYFEQDKERYESWTRDEWHYMGVSVTIRKQTESNWADGGLEVGRCSIWGIESDDSDGIKSMELDCIVDAFAEVGRLKVALGVKTDRAESMNGCDILVRSTEAIYVRIPESLQHGGYDARCTCGNCDGSGKWDTVGIPLDPNEHRTWTVHMPSNSIPAFKAHLKSKGLLPDSDSKSKLVAKTLKAYFPALGTNRDMNGADVVDVLCDLYETARKGGLK